MVDLYIALLWLYSHNVRGIRDCFVAQYAPVWFPNPMDLAIHAKGEGSRGGFVRDSARNR